MNREDCTNATRIDNKCQLASGVKPYMSFEAEDLDEFLYFCKGMNNIVCGNG